MKPSNAGEIIKQWLDVHGLPSAPMSEQMVDGHPRQVWWNADGETVIESYTIADMAHGTPLSRSEGGVAGPYMIEAGISSTDHIATFFGLTDAPLEAPAKAIRATGAAVRCLKENDTLPPHSCRASAGRERKHRQDVDRRRIRESAHFGFVVKRSRARWDEPLPLVWNFRCLPHFPQRGGTLLTGGLLVRPWRFSAERAKQAIVLRHGDNLGNPPHR